MTPSTSELQAGAAVAEYVVLGLAGRGRTGRVYRCRRGGETVAIKLFEDVVSGDGDLRARVRRGAGRAAKLSHRHLLRVHDVGTHAEQTYVVTAWVSGTSLDRIISGGRRASPAAAARTVEQLARAVAACHHDGIVHGALTPKAVLIEGTTGEPLIDDLERPVSARLGDPRVGAEHAVRDVAYTAPWDVEDERATPSGDIFALGALLHALLVGKPPGRSAADEVEIYARVPSSLRSIIGRATAASAADRYASVSTMARDLEHVATSLPGSSRLESAPSDGPRCGRRRRLLVHGARVSAALAGAALLVTGALAARSDPVDGAHAVAVSAPRTSSGGGAAAPDGGGGRGSRRPAGSPASPTTRHVPATQRLADHAPHFDLSRIRADRSTTRRFHVRGLGWVEITYRPDAAAQPDEQLGNERRDDPADGDGRAVRPDRVTVGGVDADRSVRRVGAAAIRVRHRLRAHGGQYDVVASGRDLARADRLAVTASRRILQSRFRRAAAAPGR